MRAVFWGKSSFRGRHWRLGEIGAGNSPEGPHASSPDQALTGMLGGARLRPGMLGGARL